MGRRNAEPARLPPRAAHGLHLFGLGRGAWVPRRAGADRALRLPGAGGPGRGSERARQVRELPLARYRGALLLPRHHQHGDGHGAVARGRRAAASLQRRRQQRGGGHARDRDPPERLAASVHVLTDFYFLPPPNTRSTVAITVFSPWLPASFSSSPASSQVPLQEKQRSTC